MISQKRLTKNDGKLEEKQEKAIRKFLSWVDKSARDFMSFGVSMRQKCDARNSRYKIDWPSTDHFQFCRCCPGCMCCWWEFGQSERTFFLHSTDLFPIFDYKLFLTTRRRKSSGLSAASFCKIHSNCDSRQHSACHCKLDTRFHCPNRHCFD